MSLHIDYYLTVIWTIISSFSTEPLRLTIEPDRFIILSVLERIKRSINISKCALCSVPISAKELTSVLSRCYLISALCSPLFIFNLQSEWGFCMKHFLFGVYRLLILLLPLTYTYERTSALRGVNTCWFAYSCVRNIISLRIRIYLKKYLWDVIELFRFQQ